jgi:hypothetical protein
MFPHHLPRVAALFDIPEDELTEQASRAAGSVQRLADLWARHGTADATVLRSLRSIAKRHAVKMPDKAGLQQRVNRMADAGWWRRALRKRFQAVELHQIQAGAVHRHASPYVSAKALRRHERNAARLEQQMAGLEAVNQATGEAIHMPELIDASLSNPAHRRRALMARIKGIEASANAKGHAALFLTLTCPSCMHPRHFSGARNNRYDGTRPNLAQRYLRWVWSKAMRRAEHLGLTSYGLRVVEPHHDACPHWHMLVFTPADQAEAFVNNLRAYALAVDPDEPGAAEHRFTVERIDPAKGSAVGYVAKYVSKAIDGEGVDGDSETTGDGRSTARRQIAWARTWGIRQFQFFGVPPITPTRELYRVDGETLPGHALRELHSACKANDYAAWLATVEAHGLRFRVDYSEQPSTRYRDETSKAIQGLHIQGGDLPGALQLTTRCDTWRIQPRAKAGAGSTWSEGASPAPETPWTRFNNSATLDFKGLFPDALPADVENFEGWRDAGAVSGKRPAPGTATRCRTRPGNSQAGSLSPVGADARSSNTGAQGGTPC